MAVTECNDYLQGCFESLRKPDGNKYKGDPLKAIYGALHSTGVFRKTEDDKWELCESKIDEYEEKLRKKFESKGAKKRELADPHFKRPRKKYTRRSGKREDLVRLLSQISSKYRDNSAANAVYFRNPFKGCDETEEKIKNRFGEEKFTLLLQIYNYFEDLLNKGINVNSEKAQRCKSSREITELSKQAETLQRQVDELKNRVAELEKGEMNEII